MDIYDDVDANVAAAIHFSEDSEVYRGGNISQFIRSDSSSESDRRWARGLLRTERKVRSYRKRHASRLSSSPYAIYTISRSEEIANANWAMSRYIQAHPKVKQYYNEGNKVFDDYEPDDDWSVGPDDYDYVRVVNNQYYNDTLIVDLTLDDEYSEEPLDFEEQEDIMDTWEMIDNIKKIEDEEFTKIIYY